MLPPLHFQRYTDFLSALEELKASVDVGENAQQNFQQVQQAYQEQILTLTAEGIDAAIAPRWQSVHTEMHRTMRLLQADILFLGASRQSAIATSRQAACLARIEQLIGYCQVLISY
ncbi:MAG: heterocyst frequency control protein PatD [Cyanobacteriota bacterium]|nr:heterocyst frequency control protein PatD [Cyanobacteriota bacterium]